MPQASTTPPAQHLALRGVPFFHVGASRAILFSADLDAPHDACGARAFSLRCPAHCV